MFKYLFFGALIVGALVFAANRGLHRLYLERVETEEIFSDWQGRFDISLFAEFATLPEYDRALVEQRCAPVYESYLKLRGTRDQLDHRYEPVCQALIYSGWVPEWNVQKGFEFIRDPSRFRTP